MQRISCVVVAAIFAIGFLISGVHAQVGQWKAVAINSWGWGFAIRVDEYSAKSAAITACEQRTGRTCGDWQMAVSVPWNWHVVGVNCGGVTAAGGSQYTVEIATHNASQKVGFQYCTIIILR